MYRDPLTKLKKTSPFYPLPIAILGAKALKLLLKNLLRIGIDAKMPAELLFLNQIYKTQTLDPAKFQSTSFTNPMPNETTYPNYLK